MQFGRLYQAAPELRVRTWIDGSGEPMDTPLRLDDLGFGYKIIFLITQMSPPRCQQRLEFHNEN